MRLKDIYRVVVEEGIKHDPRGEKAVLNELKERKLAFEKLPKEKRDEFDQYSLENPYADTRILYGKPEKEVKRVLVGIDMEAGELLLADRYNSKNKNKIDLCISHHPEGVALAGLYDVMGVQVDILSRCGVPVNIGEDLMSERIEEVKRKIHPVNHNRSVDAARLLDMPMMCMHTTSDNFAYSHIQDSMDKRKPDKLEDIIDILKEIPEYKLAIQDKVGPKIIKGEPKRKAGKILVEMTGGTEGSKDIYSSFSQAGIGTIICMHLSEEHFRNAKDKHINIIVAGHIASDNIGVNLLLDKIQKKGKLEIIPCSGFRRVNR